MSSAQLTQEFGMEMRWMAVPRHRAPLSDDGWERYDWALGSTVAGTNHGFAFVSAPSEPWRLNPSVEKLSTDTTVRCSSSCMRPTMMIDLLPHSKTRELDHSLRENYCPLSEATSGK